jgi:hypothetical protein
MAHRHCKWTPKRRIAIRNSHARNIQEPDMNSEQIDHPPQEIHIEGVSCRSPACCTPSSPRSGTAGRWSRSSGFSSSPACTTSCPGRARCAPELTREIRKHEEQALPEPSLPDGFGQGMREPLQHRQELAAVQARPSLEACLDVNRESPVCRLVNSERGILA